MPVPSSDKDSSFASSYLTSQGWVPGSALQKGGLKKPITVAHKTNLKGLGRERDTGYAWWDDVFSMVANKGKWKATSSNEDIRKTSAGIYSSRPPNGSTSTSRQDSGCSTPVACTSTNTGIFNTDIIGQAKLEAARREFYAKFLRGKPLAGSVEQEQREERTENIAVMDDGESAMDENDKAKRRIEKQERKRLRQEKRERKELKRQRKQTQQGQLLASQQMDTSTTAEATTPQLKKDKKRKRENTTDNTTTDLVAVTTATSLPTPPPTDGELEPDQEQAEVARTAAKRAKKEERRRNKKEERS